MGEVVWVYLERDAEGISDSSLQVVAGGHALAEQLKGRLEGVCVGGDVDVLKSLAGPVEKVLHFVGESLEDYTTDGFGSVLEEQIAGRQPSILIFPTSTQGEDLASWLGAGLGVGVLLGAQEVRREGGCLVATRVEFEGKVAVDYELRGTPAMVSLLEGTTDMTLETGGEMEIETVGVSAPQNGVRTRIIKTEVARKTVNLREARVIVGVGAGLGGEDAFKYAQELADLLGGEVGATRAAVDAGWVSYDRQIGQTGVKVRPDLYIALGISGAAQHRVGMLDSGTIVAVNIDPHAPIFRFSHYCVEGDLKLVLPKLIEISRR
jgi:electron transfer flavoprotein alpha subunit